MPVAAIAAFAVLGLLALYDVQRLSVSRDAALKRRQDAPIAAGKLILLALFLWLAAAPLGVVVILAVLAVPFWLATVRGVRHCDGCGRTVMPPSWLRGARTVCPHCEAPLHR